LNHLSGPSDDKVSPHGLLHLASKEPQRRAAVVSGLAYGILAALGWGVGLAAARHGFSVGFEPLDLLFIRFVVATPLFLVAFCVMRRWDRLAKTKVIVAAAQAFFGGPMLAICVSIAGRKAPFAGGVLLEVASLTVCSIVLARLVLGEKLGFLRTVAMLALTLRLVLLAMGSLDDGTPDVAEGMVLFAAAGLAAATFAALTCRWHVDPISTMTIVSVASLATLGSYYMFFYGLSRLSIVLWPYLLEQIIAQGVIAGVLSWIGFLYAARILGLVTASFMPAMTPAVASLIALGITRESPTVFQWLLIARGTIGAALLMTSLHARRTVLTDNRA
jgi:drug/metabolite transporter (DMT)-like permease